MKEQVVIDLQLMSHEPLNKIQSEDKTHLNHTQIQIAMSQSLGYLSQILFSLSRISQMNSREFSTNRVSQMT